MKLHRILAIVLLLISMSSVYTLIAGTPRYRLLPAPIPTPKAPAAPETVRFAAIGDYGTGNQAESDVAALVKSWNPDFVITLGDNNYPSGEATTIDQNIGQDYADFIFPYTGVFGPGAADNRFFPALGNHDWISLGCVQGSCTGPYFDYFALPGHERYYDFVRGPVHFFVIDSDPHEPDGRDAESVQAAWLREGLQRSAAPWKLVYMHHTIYSSSLHGSDLALQWPYREWGASAVLTGHDHTYERVMFDGFPYFVNGMGGAGIRTFGAPVPGSTIRYNGDHGAQRIEASETELRFQFINRAGQVIDDFAIDHSAQPTSVPTPVPTPQATVVLQSLADAFVNADDPSTNFGTDALLEIDGSPQKLAYLLFDMRALAGATLRSAHLRLRVAQIAGAESTSSQTVRLTDGRDWDEASLVFTNRPGLANGQVGTFNGGSQGEWVSVGLTTTLQTFFGEFVTFAIESSGGDGLDVSSREGNDPPELVVAYDRPTTTATATSQTRDTPTTTPTPTATPTTTPTTTAIASSTPTATPMATKPPEETPGTNVYLPKVNR